MLWSYSMTLITEMRSFSPHEKYKYLSRVEKKSSEIESSKGQHEDAWTDPTLCIW